MIAGSSLLANIPAALRDPLVAEYKGIAAAFTQGRWKLAGLDGGRFCEVAYTIVHGAVTGTFASTPSKPPDFVASCRALESRPPIAVGDRSLRILIPRVLVGLYEIRNNRNVGHVAGDIVSNKMDATYVRDAATWVIAELVRVFHSVSTQVAQVSVDSLVERVHPLVWEKDGIKRVLDPKMSASERTLILLYYEADWCSAADLRTWVKGDRNYRTAVLAALAKKSLLEMDATAERVVITPLGIGFVEKKLL